MKQNCLLFSLFVLPILSVVAQEDTTRLQINLPLQPLNVLETYTTPANQYVPSDQYHYNQLNKSPLASLSDNQLSLVYKQTQKKTIFNASYSRFIIPTVLIGYGVVTRGNHALKSLDTSTKHEVREHFTERINLDDYLQFAPAVAVYGLDFAGIKAKHNFRDRTIIMATSHLVMASSVYIVKNTMKVERPDGSAKNSFPSGHTATAFVGAHILFKEYKDVSPWIGIGGYAVATATGTMRVLNDKHWVSDVVTGAGVGILSAEVGYMLLPVWHNIFGIKDKNKSLVIVPTVTPQSAGLGMSYTF